MSFPRLLSWTLALSLAVSVGGCVTASSKKKDKKIAVARFMIEASPGEASGTARLPKSGTVIMVSPKAQFSEYDIARCQAVENELGKSLVFEFTPQAAKDLYRLTATNQGKRIVTVINGTPVGAQRITAPLSEGYVVTYVEVDEKELETLAADITRTSVDGQKELAKKQ